jgi:phosphohistidine phosphatase
MKLYFLRHAHAEPGADDAARPLSEKGKAQCAQLGHFCKQAAIVFDAAYSSPLLRARQTTDLVLDITNPKHTFPVQETDALLNGVCLDEFHDWLDTLPGAKHLLLVGHNPSLTDWVRHLTGITDPDRFSLPKGGLACLKTEDRRAAALKFFISPKIL